MTNFCFKCKHDDDKTQLHEKSCSILAATFVYTVDHPNYPDEWIFDEDGFPTCTEFEKEE